jgi:hypothetical protein
LLTGSGEIRTSVPLRYLLPSFPLRTSGCYNALNFLKGGTGMFQPDLLKGRAIFLTGGGTGLGRSMAIHFAKLGARLFVVGRREQPLKEVCDEIHKNGGAAAYALCDVRDFSAVKLLSPLRKSNSAKSTRWSTMPLAISWRAPKNSHPMPSTPSSASF